MRLQFVSRSGLPPKTGRGASSLPSNSCSQGGDGEKSLGIFWSGDQNPLPRSHQVGVFLFRLTQLPMQKECPEPKLERSGSVRSFIPDTGLRDERKGKNCNSLFLALATPKGRPRTLGRWPREGRSANQRFRKKRTHIRLPP